MFIPLSFSHTHTLPPAQNIHYITLLYSMFCDLMVTHTHSQPTKRNILPSCLASCLTSSQGIQLQFSLPNSFIYTVLHSTFVSKGQHPCLQSEPDIERLFSIPRGCWNLRLFNSKLQQFALGLTQLIATQTIKDQIGGSSEKKYER